MTKKSPSQIIPAREPKDKVLHTRIPDQLDQHLRNRAENLGLSVSSIVRNVLLNTFDLVEGVVTDSANIARSLGVGGGSSIAQAAVPLDESKVLGWQTLKLNLNAVCHQCNHILPKGSQAGMAVPLTEPPVFICETCIDKLEQDA